jgi:hypothetical protein
MKRLPVLGVLIAILGCDLNPGTAIPVAAAQTITRQYSKRKLRAHAAGDDCGILLVQARTALDNTTVESIHYGTGENHVYDGGIQQFAEDNRFRAVVYRDAAGDLWTYGSITLDEARTMSICR